MAEVNRAFSGRIGMWTPEWSCMSYVPHMFYTMKNMTYRKLHPSAFEYEAVLRIAIERGQLNRNRIVEIPDEKWWKKLCDALGEKSLECSRYGSHMLRDRAVTFLMNRLLVEESLSLRSEEIKKENIAEPIFVVGMPRSNKHIATHMWGRSGYTTPLRYCDTMHIGIINEEQRINAAHRSMQGFRWLHPQMRTVRVWGPEATDDDIALQLQSPRSLAWGLLHGMPDYLYECIQEDQLPVYEHSKRCLQLLQWYRTCGHYSDGVSREVTPIDNPLDAVLDGSKDELEHDKLPWLVHSPLGILSMPDLHTVYPDMRVIWMHRAVRQSIQSLCSSLALHEAMYVGRAPRETNRTQLGELVLGLFGSGTEQAVDYMGNFDFMRQVHWGNKDHVRSGIRLMQKTRKLWFGDVMDNFRKVQAIGGYTEQMQEFRPHHDCELEYFGVHEGMLNDSFRAYMFQFAEFAFEDKYGIELQEYQPIAGTYDESKFGLRQVSFEVGEKATNLTQMPTEGHLLQQAHIFRPTSHVMSRPKPLKRELSAKPPT